MAIFQRKFERLLTIDDTEQLSATIESSQTVDGHTVRICVFFKLCNLQSLSQDVDSADPTQSADFKAIFYQINVCGY